MRSYWVGISAGIALAVSGCASSEDAAPATAGVRSSSDGASESEAGSMAGDSSDMFADAGEAMRSLTSVHLHGRRSVDDRTWLLDLSVDADGQCEGAVGLHGGHASIVKVGGKSWFKADADVWRALANDRLATTVADQWVPLGAQPLGGLCDLDYWLDTLAPAPGMPVTYGSAVDFGGEEALVFTVDGPGPRIRVWARMGQPHYVLKYDVRSPGDHDVIVLSQFDETLHVRPPT